MSPVREAKGRYVVREYMADREWMTEYTAPEREWYILTALFTDDTGYLPWDLADNAANLYRYESPAKRERRVAGYVAHFAASGRFQDLGCGHAYMPSVGKRPRGHHREEHVREEHQQCVGSALVMHSESSQVLPATVPHPSVPIPNRTSPVADGSSKERTTERKPTNPQSVAEILSTPGSLAAMTGLDPATLKASTTP